MIRIIKMEPRHRGRAYEILQKTDMFTLAEISVAMELIDTFLFNEEQKDYMAHVAEDDQAEMCGYVCYGPTPATEGTFDIYWIAVAPERQNQGIGTKLLHFVEQEITRQNGRLIVIETSSQSKYAATLSFYQRNRYGLESRIADFYRPGDDRLIYIKHL